MHHSKLNLRIMGLAAAVVAVVLAAGSFTPRETHASYADPSGVMCGYLTGMTLNGNPLGISGVTLSRVDSDGVNVEITSVAYTAPDAVTLPDCQTPQELIPKDPAVIVPDVLSERRPSVTGLTYDSGTNVMGGAGCHENFTFGGITMTGWTRIILNLNLAPTKTAGKASGTFTFKNAYATEADCQNDVGYTPGVGTVVVNITSKYLDGPDEAKTAYNSDWDKDGVLDWEELDPNQVHRDPFNPGDANIGGIAEPMEVGSTPLDAAESSSSNRGLIAALAAAAAAALAVAGGAAWFVRRRVES